MFSACEITSYSWRFRFLIFASRLVFSVLSSSFYSCMSLIFFSFSTANTWAYCSSRLMAAWIFSISLRKFYSSVSFNLSSCSSTLIFYSKSSFSRAYLWNAFLRKNFLSQIRQHRPSFGTEEGEAAPLIASFLANYLVMWQHFSQARWPQNSLYSTDRWKRGIHLPEDLWLFWDFFAAANTLGVVDIKLLDGLSHGEDVVE